MTEPTTSNSVQYDPKKDSEIPYELWRKGIWFSILLISGGLIVMWMADGLSADILLSIGALAVCIGFGIALAVFGNRAGGTFLTFNVVGGGATAIALYLLIGINPIKNTPKFLIGNIYQTSKLKDVRGRAEQVFLTGRTTVDGDFRFFAFENELGNGVVRFNFEWPEDIIANDESIPKELFINCIPAETLKNAIALGQTLSLELEALGEGQFRLMNTSSGVAMGRQNDSNCFDPISEPSIADEVGSLDIFLLMAFAQVGEPVDIPMNLALLESADGELRDQAREKLASLREADAYKAVVDSWNIFDSSYRADLGRLVAWSTAINQDRAMAVLLAEALSSDQLRYVVQLTGQGDITMRQLATNVLYRLLETTSWPSGPSPERAQNIVEVTLEALTINGPELVLKSSMRFIPDNLLYNTIVAVDFANCNILDVYRLQILDRMTALSAELVTVPSKARTSDKIKKVIDNFGTCT